MVKYLPLLGLALSSCSTLVEYGDVLSYGNSAKSICEASECPDPDSVSLTISIADKIIQTWGYEHTENFESVSITWKDYENGPYYGLTKSPTEITIYDISPGNVQGSALGHELIHVALWEQTGDPDPTHESLMFDKNNEHTSAEDEIREIVRQYDL